MRVLNGWFLALNANVYECAIEWICCSFWFWFMSSTTHQQTQLICPQCNKYKERLNRFPRAVRLLYARVAYALIQQQKQRIQTDVISLYCSFFFSMSMNMTRTVCIAQH